MSCPEGLKPSVDYVTCERYGRSHKGEWKHPTGVERSHNVFEGIICLEPKCQDLNEKFYDDTVNVSLFFVWD